MDYRAYFDGVWERAVPAEGSEYRLQPEMHFLYLMAHTAKHILNHGSGVRPFLDMVFFCREETLDWTWITAELQRLQLLEFTRTCFSLCRHWLGAELPLESIGLKEEFLQSAAEKMLRGGVFGLEDPENEIGAAAKNVIGIAAGLLDGMDRSALKGALMSRGTREIARLIKAMGGNELSAYGLCHLGDYEATVFSRFSQNRQFGENFAKGESYTKLAEGYYTVKALRVLSERYAVELPICHAVYAILYENADPFETMNGLFKRRVTNELHK